MKYIVKGRYSTINVIYIVCIKSPALMFPFVSIIGCLNILGQFSAQLSLHMLFSLLLIDKNISD